MTMPDAAKRAQLTQAEAQRYLHKPAPLLMAVGGQRHRVQALADCTFRSILSLILAARH